MSVRAGMNIILLTAMLLLAACGTPPEKPTPTAIPAHPTAGVTTTAPTGMPVPILLPTPTSEPIPTSEPTNKPADGSEAVVDFSIYEIPQGLAQFLSSKRDKSVVLFGLERGYDAANYITDFEFISIDGEVHTEWAFSDMYYVEYRPYQQGRFIVLYDEMLLNVWTHGKSILYDADGNYISEIDRAWRYAEMVNLPDGDRVLSRSAGIEYLYANGPGKTDFYLMDTRTNQVERLPMSFSVGENLIGAVVEKSRRNEVVVFEYSGGSLSLYRFDRQRGELTGRYTCKDMQDVRPISLIDGVLYYCTGDTLYEYTLDTGLEKSYDISGYIAPAGGAWDGYEVEVVWEDISGDGKYAVAFVQTPGIERIAMAVYDFEQDTISLCDLTEYKSLCWLYEEYSKDTEHISFNQYTCVFVTP